MAQRPNIEGENNDEHTIGEFAEQFMAQVPKEQVMQVTLAGRRWDVSWNNFPLEGNDIVG
jgi:hypothetical protein